MIKIVFIKIQEIMTALQIDTEAEKVANQVNIHEEVNSSLEVMMISMIRVKITESLKEMKVNVQEYINNLSSEVTMKDIHKIDIPINRLKEHLVVTTYLEVEVLEAEEGVQKEETFIDQIEEVVAAVAKEAK